MGLALVVHGGAGVTPPDRFEAARHGCGRAALAGWRVLREGGAALDAVQAAIVALEDDPTFNAGTGAVLTTDGRAQLDAGLMDGKDLNVGAAAGLERVKNPVLLARRILDSPHVLLMGQGAERFAEQQGMALCEQSDLITPARLQAWRSAYATAESRALSAPVGPALSGIGVGEESEPHGTVGAVALDAHGCIAAGASTGGFFGKYPGRVGDTPLAGCGFYAENGLGGASSTGHGEHYIRLLLAHRAVEYMAAGQSAQAAASAAMRTLGARTGGTGGIILIDSQGRVGAARNTPAMACAYLVEGMDHPIECI
jgi:beta-aspartyl-peptidase (threonine type)